MTEVAAAELPALTPESIHQRGVPADLATGGHRAAHRPHGGWAVLMSPCGMMTPTSAGAENAMTNREQRRLRRSVALHGFAVVVFAMLALCGASTAAPGLYGMAVPFIIAGTTGGIGAAVITVSVWRAQGRDAGADARKGAGVRTGSNQAVPPRPIRSAAPQLVARLAMAAAAVVVLISGVVLAPRGMDRGFVISVAALLAVALALFALLAGDRPRSDEQPTSARNPPE